MTDEYEVYEQKCKTTREVNAELLAGFEAWLAEKGLGANTMSKTYGNCRRPWECEP